MRETNPSGGRRNLGVDALRCVAMLLLFPRLPVGAGLAPLLICDLADSFRALLFRGLRVSRGAAQPEAALRRWLAKTIKETNG